MFYSDGYKLLDAVLLNEVTLRQYTCEQNYIYNTHIPILLESTKI